MVEVTTIVTLYALIEIANTGRVFWGGTIYKQKK